MTDRHDIDPEPTAEERAVDERLRSTRPLPAPGFRGALGRHLAARDPGYGPRPARLRWISSGCVAASAAVLAVAALQATGTI